MGYPVMDLYPSQAEKDVLAERERQRADEGFDAAHDDGHVDGELAHAGACYAVAAAEEDEEGTPPPAAWPWDRTWWKPTDRRRTLVMAAALLIAEIERIDRARAKGDTA